MKRSLLLAVTILALASLAMAGTTVCDFETIGSGGTVPDGYCNITWGGVWGYYSGFQPPYNPHSGEFRTYEPVTGAGEDSFTLNSPAVFDGAWFSGYPSATVYFNLYDASNNLLWTSASLDPSDIPTWLASGYSGVGSKVGVYSANQDFYVMDDVTYGTATPEPGTIALLATGALGAIGTLRRRFQR